MADATGPMKATFFNQPWLERKYRPGTRLMLSGKFEGRNRFRVLLARRRPARRSGADRRRGRDLPGHRGAELDPDPRAGARAPRPALADVLEPLPAALRVARAAARPRRRRSAPRTSATTRAGRVRLAFEELLLLQLALLRRRARRREGARAEPLDGPARPQRALARALAPVRADGRPAARDRRRSTRTWRAARPMQRLLMGEVGSGKTVVALHAMLRAVEHGAQAALMAPTETLAEQHFATLQRLMPGELVQAALLTGSTSAARRTRPARQARQRRAQAAGRHARADRDRRGVRPPRGRGRRRAAPLRRQPAPRAGPQGAGGARAARAAHDGHADPAHARADRLRRPRRHRAARAAGRAAPDRHARRGQRGRAGARLRAHPRGAARGPPGVRRLPARGGVRGPAGARRHRGVRAPEGLRAARLPRSRCCTAGSRRARSRPRWPRSPTARPTCWWPRR